MPPKLAKVPVIPKPFSGKAQEDASKYIISFERAAKCNLWNDDTKLAYFPVYLEGTAALWFKSYSKHPNFPNKTWNEVSTAFKDAFTSTSRVEIAELKLLARKQRVGESAEDYIYEMIDLCENAEPGMAESKKIRFIIKGMRPTFLEKINFLDPKTLEELLAYVRKMYETRLLLTHSDEIQEVLGIETQQPDKSALDHITEAMNKMLIVINKQNEKMDTLALQKEELGKEKCKHCSGEHSSNNCPNCYTCGQPGHISRRCYRNTSNPRFSNGYGRQYSRGRGRGAVRGIWRGRSNTYSE